MRNRWNRATAAVVLSVAIAFSAPVLTTGCASSPNQVAYATVGLTVHTVDLAMKTWADYVVAGYATAEQESKVRAAHDKYFDTAFNLKVILTATSQEPTPAQLSSVAASVVSLIEQFTGKKVS